MRNNVLLNTSYHFHVCALLFKKKIRRLFISFFLRRQMMSRLLHRVYHGCANKNADDTNRVIEKNHICFWPTDQPYWKRIRDVENDGVKTCSQELAKKKVKWQDFKRYCRFRGREDLRRWLEADDSEVYVMKETDTFRVVQ